jgi:AraC-like DNA-binding protein
VLPDLLARGEASAEALAKLAYMSPRTLQRRLAAEGTHVAQLRDEARRALALERLADGSTQIADIAVQLGYASTPTFSRAVRRWTGEPPRQVRHGAPGRASGGVR